MELIPSNDNIIIKLEKEETKENKTKSGIILNAKTTTERPNQGEVYAVGIGRITSSGVRVKSEINKGDSVIFNQFAGVEVCLEDNKYLILKENDILAIVKK